MQVSLMTRQCWRVRLPVLMRMSLLCTTHTCQKEMACVQRMRAGAGLLLHADDPLHNGAGGRCAAGDPAEWERMLKVNLLAPMILMRYLAPALARDPTRGGYILNVSSIYGRDPVPSFGAYAATKHGLTGWTLSTYAVRTLLDVAALLTHAHLCAVYSHACCTVAQNF